MRHHHKRSSHNCKVIWIASNLLSCFQRFGPSLNSFETILRFSKPCAMNSPSRTPSASLLQFGHSLPNLLSVIDGCFAESTQTIRSENVWSVVESSQKPKLSSYSSKSRGSLSQDCKDCGNADVVTSSGSACIASAVCLSSLRICSNCWICSTYA